MSASAKKFFVICLLVVLCGYGAYSVLLPTYYIRYRLSLDVEVGGKVQTSSSVIEISYQILPDGLAYAGGPGGAFHGFMHGAALTIDLGEKGLLFLLNTRPEACVPIAGNCRLSRPEGEALWTLPLVAYGFPGEDLPSAMAKYLAQLRMKQGPIDVPIESLPMFVRFRDLSSLQTVEEIDPRDLAATFGPDVRLVRARLELTRDPITPIPASWPKWLLEAKNMGSGIRTAPVKLSDELYRSYFIGD
jgi:hypothetical protein